MNSRVLVADDDTVFCRYLSKVLQKGGFDVEVVQDGTEALARLSGQSAPGLALLDWVMPGMSGVDVCRKLRESATGASTYVILVSGRQSEEDMLEGFDAGVDEFLAKPFDPQVFVARLQAVERRRQAEGARGGRGLVGLLKEASLGATGEVVVRSEGRVGRVVFHQGKIAWIHVSEGGSMLPLLTKLGLAEGDVHLALEECRKQRLPFMDTLVGWGLVSRERLEEQFRVELASRLKTLLKMPASVSFFIPAEAHFHSGFAYDLSQIEPWLDGPLSIPVPEPSGPQSHTVSPAMEKLAHEVARMDGVLGVSLIDRSNGLVALSSGEPHNTTVLRGMIRLAQADPDDAPEESLLIGATSYHVLRSISGPWMIYAHIDRARNPNIGLLRFALSQQPRPAGASAPRRG